MIHTRSKEAVRSLLMNFPILESQAPPDLRAQIQRVEDQSDKWLDGLALPNFPRDVAVWGALTQIVALIEEHIDLYGHGSQKQREAMINLGRDGALLLKNLLRREFPEKEIWLRWTPELREASKQAVMLAHNYETFVSCFSMWHKDRQKVEVLSPTRLRFSTLSSPTDRRIRAHQQGARIEGWPSTRDNPVDKSFVDDPDVALRVSRLADTIELEGALAMRYPDDRGLLITLRDIFYRKLQSAFRRDPTLDLGGYALADVRWVFAALYSLCAVHEFLCDFWRKRCGRYPFESAVMVKPTETWLDLLSDISGVSVDRVRRVVADLTFGVIRPLDIYIHLFTPSGDGGLLFVIPHFVLNTRPEENILRVCSYARPEYYSVISNAKETEMIEQIRQDAPSRYRISGPLKLPDPKLPDIDLIITDTGSSTILVGELKWIRKPSHVLEHFDRNADLEKGFGQLRDIRDFLLNRTEFLQKAGIPNCKEEPVMTYCVVARDHLIDKLEDDGIWLTELDALLWALMNSGSLPEATTKLKELQWLPQEGREFKVTFETSSVAGVAIEAETFHRPSPAPLGTPNASI